MVNISRRGFLAGTAAAAAALTVNVIRAEDAPKAAAETVKKCFPDGFPTGILGKTGLKTSILGMGTGMSNGNPYINMGEAAFCELMHRGFDQGVRYVDTAQNYRTHMYVQRALRGWNREDFHILTKTPSRTEDRVKGDIDRYLYELNTGYLDTLLMHCMFSGNWPTELAGPWNVLQNAKKEGKVRSVGVSCHHLDALKACLEVDDLDVVLARINPFGVDYVMDDATEKVVPVLKALHEKGVGVIAMKVFGEGKCTEAAQRRESLEFVTGLECVDIMTIGFTKTSEVDETIGMLAEILG